MLLEGVEIANPTTNPETPLFPSVTLPLMVEVEDLSTAVCALAIAMAVRRRRRETMISRPEETITSCLCVFIRNSVESQQGSGRLKGRFAAIEYNVVLARSTTRSSCLRDSRSGGDLS